MKDPDNSWKTIDITAYWEEGRWQYNDMKDLVRKYNDLEEWL